MGAAAAGIGSMMGKAGGLAPLLGKSALGSMLSQNSGGENTQTSQASPASPASQYNPIFGDSSMGQILSAFSQKPQSQLSDSMVKAFSGNQSDMDELSKIKLGDSLRKRYY